MLRSRIIAVLGTWLVHQLKVVGRDSVTTEAPGLTRLSGFQIVVEDMGAAHLTIVVGALQQVGPLLNSTISPPPCHMGPRRPIVGGAKH